MPKQKFFMDCSELDDLVKKTYKRTFSFQQQDGCKDRGTHHVTVPIQHPEDYTNDEVPVNKQGDARDEQGHEVMGVSFKGWLARDPALWKGSPKWHREMYWERNFYPHVDMVLNDLHAKGLLPAGEYVIEIDW